jgi:CrcB protein
LGGAIGAVCRVALSTIVNPKDQSQIPWGTLIINFLSCLGLGFILQFSLSFELQILFITGFLGAFSTFSTVMWECARFRKNRLKLWAYLLLTILAGFAGFEFGNSL